VQGWLEAPAQCNRLVGLQAYMRSAPEIGSRLSKSSRISSNFWASILDIQDVVDQVQQVGAGLVDQVGIFDISAGNSPHILARMMSKSP